MNQNNISAAELFLRVRELLILPELEPKTRNKMMHDTLILCCHEGVKETKQAFGNLFSQVDYLCKAHGIKVADKIAIQTMRRHSNSQEPLSSEDLKYDARALAIFISAVFGVDVPHELNVLIPHTNRPYQKGLEINNRRIRCIVKTGGGPFGAVIAKDGIIIAEASNSVTIDLDPTAHAEVNCIRQATRKLKTFNLEGCEIYTSCEPCPMCLGAIYWAHLDRIYYANDRKDAAKIGFDDEFIYEEIDRKIEDRHKPMIALMRDEALGAFRMWEKNAEKTEY
jgi:guanine deaminase